ncbi:hypothetical protein CRG98_039076 [Punica granatum]|uniref:Uncharacterized protein n=1 Tax=Punica granatum TaxID=22663 RepID=A0A2I0IAX6_PUNGR|nr:hypothetical protein CRG98_039076 [Punica granatum]
MASDRWMKILTEGKLLGCGWQGKINEAEVVKCVNNGGGGEDGEGRSLERCREVDEFDGMAFGSSSGAAIGQICVETERLVIIGKSQHHPEEQIQHILNLYLYTKNEILGSWNGMILTTGDAAGRLTGD